MLPLPTVLARTPSQRVRTNDGKVTRNATMPRQCQEGNCNERRTSCRSCHRKKVHHAGWMDEWRLTAETIARGWWRKLQLFALQTLNRWWCSCNSLSGSDRQQRFPHLQKSLATCALKMWKACAMHYYAIIRFVIDSCSSMLFPVCLLGFPQLFLHGCPSSHEVRWLLRILVASNFRGKKAVRCDAISSFFMDFDMILRKSDRKGNSLCIRWWPSFVPICILYWVSLQDLTKTVEEIRPRPSKTCDSKPLKIIQKDPWRQSHPISVSSDKCCSAQFGKAALSLHADPLSSAVSRLW